MAGKIPAICIGGPMDGKLLMLEPGMSEFKFQGVTLDGMKQSTTIYGYTVQELWGGEKKFWVLLAEGISLDTGMQLLWENYKPLKMTSEPEVASNFLYPCDAAIKAVVKVFSKAWMSPATHKKDMMDDIEQLALKLLEWGEQIEKEL